MTRTPTIAEVVDLQLDRSRNSPITDCPWTPEHIENVATRMRMLTDESLAAYEILRASKTIDRHTQEIENI